VVRRKKKGKSALFALTLDIIGIHARRAIQKTLQLCKQSGNNVSILIFISFFFLSKKYIDHDMYCSFRGPPKKKAKSAHSSIVPLEDDAPAASMSFPPRFAIYYSM